MPHQWLDLPLRHLRLHPVEGIKVGQLELERAGAGEAHRGQQREAVAGDTLVGWIQYHLRPCLPNIGVLLSHSASSKDWTIE